MRLAATRKLIATVLEPQLAFTPSQAGNAMDRLENPAWLSGITRPRDGAFNGAPWLQPVASTGLPLAPPLAVWELAASARA
jgi:hypothetical protein